MAQLLTERLLKREKDVDDVAELQSHAEYDRTMLVRPVVFQKQDALSGQLSYNRVRQLFIKGHCQNVRHTHTLDQTLK